ncbi:non-ribosomal peptide synthetase [Streptomyces sp. NPDC001985]|uniref:non-ribosomal peptide synthetase n=1 Tax=Streptomyces sp. NPDC001985 TaxID=3154406 RepID=UPI003327E4E4
MPQHPAPGLPHDAPGDARADAALAQALESVFGTGAADDTSTFAELGGDSLRAVRVLSACWRTLGTELPIQALKPATRMGDFRELLRKAVAETGGRAPAEAGRPPGAPAPRPGDPVRLPPALESLYSLHTADPGNPAYNVPLTLSFSGAPDPERLRAALADVVARHGALRTVFTSGADGPVGTRTEQPPEWESVDLSPLRGAALDARVEREIDAAALAPFDLARTPLRARLLRLSPDRSLLVLVLHHLVCDAWSLRLITADLLTACAEGPGTAPRPPAPDALDVAAWERAELGRERRERLAAHWRGALAGLPAVLELPTDRPRPATRSFRGDRIPVTVDRATTGALRALARRRNVTLFTVLAAACALTLRRHTGQDDFVLGFPVAGRTRPEFDQVAGYLTKTVPLAVRLSGRPTLSALLTGLHEEIDRAREHALLPLEAIAEAAGVPREPGVPTLIQCALVLFSGDSLPAPPPGLDVEIAERSTGTAKFDLNWYLDESDGGLSGYAEYATDLFDRATVERLHGHFAHALTALAAADPETPATAVPVLTPAERALLLDQEGRAEHEDGAWEPVHLMFERRAAAHPEHDALWCDGERVTYGELDARAGALARELRRRGIGAESVVGIHIARSPDQMAALLGVLKAGAAYLPLDPAYPVERLTAMVGDAGPAAVVTSGPAGTKPLDAVLGATPLIDLNRLPAGAAEPQGPPARATEPDGLAYVIYTSGTTGRPKGVQITHRALAKVIACSVEDFGLGPGSRVLQVVSFNFDASVWEIFMALSSGATLCLGPPDVARAEQGIEEVIRASGATVVYLPPALLSLVDPAAVPSVRIAITGGDLVTGDLRERWTGRCRFFVAYGPTEGTIVQTWQEHDERFSAALPIGVPFDGVRLYVLDRELEPVPPGAVGEVHIGGTAVSRGYLNRPGTTAGHYLPDPHSPLPGARMYRTGDHVRRLPGGELTFVGRRDHQVKVRGYRIEPAEVEAALLRLDAVGAAVVQAEPGPQGRARLVAYVVAPGLRAGFEREVREALAATLPGHMVPTRVHRVPTVPLTVNGKVDRAALTALADIDGDLLEQLLEQVENTP